MNTTSPGTKTDRIIYRVSTALIVLLIALPAVTFYTDFALNSIQHLGFPAYFGIEDGIAKVIGGIVLAVPMVPMRFKEWAYVGYGIDFISAIIANAVVIGPGMAMLPVVALIVLAVSYIYFHKTHVVYAPGI
ncbi:MAG: hypothetical protein JWM56_564 [Candidatus Peribacteria bacterium]|nr:hypothetical protein [Candidatus Peribacteria bacterium]